MNEISTEQPIKEQLAQTLEALKKKPIIKKGLDQLKLLNSRGYRFHNYYHALDVLHEVVLFALSDNLSPKDIELLAIAAVYHDAGYLKDGANNHEEEGAKMAEKAMGKKYSPAEINKVKRAILATKMNIDLDANGKVTRRYQLDLNPEDNLSGYLQDADLSNIGRRDCFIMNRYYWLELGQPEVSWQAFMKDIAQTLMTYHDWKTPTARRLRTNQQKANIHQAVGH